MKQMIWLVALANCAFAQQMAPIHIDSCLSGNRIMLNGIGEYQSTAVHGEMMSTLLWGGYIDTEMKDRSFKKHNSFNRIGANANAEFTYQHLNGNFLGRANLGWQVKGGYYAIGNINYDQDLFGLAFYGNQRYAGDNATFDNTFVTGMVFQKIGFGLVDKNGGSSISLSYVNVSDYIGGNVRNGVLYQSSSGDSLDLWLRGDLATTSGARFDKGGGLAIDADLRIHVPWFFNRTANFQISGQNLGFAVITNSLTKYSSDTTFSYSGFQLSQFSNGNQLLGDNFSLLDSLGIQKTTGRKTIGLPGYIQVAKMVSDSLPIPVQSFFGIRFYPGLRNAPLIYAGAYWRVVEMFGVSGALNYGGFGNLRGGVYLNGKISDVICWSAGTDDIAGIISKRAYGSNLVARLEFQF